MDDSSGPTHQALEHFQLQQQLERCDARVLTLTGENLVMRERLASLSTQVNTSNVNASAAAVSLTAAYNDATERVSSLVGENDTLRGLLRVHQRRVEVLQQTVASLEAGVAGRDDLLAASQARHTTLAAEHAELRALAGDLHGELEREREGGVSLREGAALALLRESALQQRLGEALGAAARASEGASAAVVEADSVRGAYQGVRGELEELKGRLEGERLAAAQALAASRAALAASESRVCDLNEQLRLMTTLGGGSGGAQNSSSFSSSMSSASVLLDTLGGRREGEQDLAGSSVTALTAGQPPPPLPQPPHPLTQQRLESLKAELEAATAAWRQGQGEVVALRQALEESKATATHALRGEAAATQALAVCREECLRAQREAQSLAQQCGEREQALEEAKSSASRALLRLHTLAQEKDTQHLDLLTANTNLARVGAALEAATTRAVEAEARWARESASAREAWGAVQRLRVAAGSAGVASAAPASGTPYRGLTQEASGGGGYYPNTALATSASSSMNSTFLPPPSAPPTPARPHSTIHHPSPANNVSLASTHSSGGGVGGGGAALPLVGGPGDASFHTTLALRRDLDTLHLTLAKTHASLSEY